MSSSSTEQPPRTSPYPATTPLLASADEPHSPPTDDVKSAGTDESCSPPPGVDAARSDLDSGLDSESSEPRSSKILEQPDEQQQQEKDDDGEDDEGDEDDEVEAFMFTGDKATLVSFSIPEGTTTLGERAFEDCESIVSVNFPDSLSTIGSYACRGCRSFTSIVLPASVSTIGIATFARCNSLAAISLPEGITTIEKALFTHCISLESVVLPSTITCIKAFAFDRCESLTSISIPDSVTSIGEFALGKCESLAYIAIPDSTTVEANSFTLCTELRRLATEAGLSIEEWGRSNWRKAKALKIRLTMVSCIKQLSLLDYEELDNHLTTIQKPQIVSDCVRFVVEIGEPGLMREIVKYAV
jgi:hypothetical protein